ncbi:PIG-L family deacetylase [Mucilaginibacter jinjuensis]|uniref:PIG-L family deacetylase n=1 Tax=Mucilaginibacter jinjuensis TaxID=1176721 RepID=A0ABY7T322_9SPHI|nr:PIG-L family deacetylase [Mucilaginibacter jinjuensis]WCT10668.1 PIG-L family deacetylase [Mucilaginibacter jinjuensis]
MKKWNFLSIVALMLIANLHKAEAQNSSTGPHVLVVMAHPDDESTFSASLYKITKEQHGTVDLFIITNGEAGYKYCTLAENYYHLELTDEKVGRSNLPRIRKQEIKNAGHILGINKYYFLDQKDSHYGLDEKDPLDTSWNVNLIKRRLRNVLAEGHYDFIFSMLPETATHGQHKAATLLALDVVSNLPADSRPIVLGARIRNKTDTAFRYTQYAGYQVSKSLTDTATFNVDRTASFSFKHRVNYKVVVNWEIAEHKSQGVMQMAMNDGDLEEFWYFSLNGQDGLSKTKALFNELSQNPYLSKTY